MNRLKFIVENHIPFIRGVFETAGVEVAYLPPSEINASTVSDADAIIVRTRTKCNAQLLEGSRCKVVATATIGLDHIDTQWCKEKGITVYNAPGCNAPAVAQYVLRSLLFLGIEPGVSTLGIVGVGNVGGIVARWAEGLGYKVMLCDPPKERVQNNGEFHPLEMLAEKCDAITFHTPLTFQPTNDATFHLADKTFFDSLKRCQAIVNSARGGVVDESALLKAIESGKVKHAVIDCWENEPMLNAELLNIASIATPHIAGYSKQGKIRATQQVIDAVCGHFKLPKLTADTPAAPPAPSKVTAKQIIDSYNPLSDTNALRINAANFEKLRNNYELREEPHE